MLKVASGCLLPAVEEGLCMEFFLRYSDLKSCSEGPVTKPESFQGFLLTKLRRLVPLRERHQPSWKKQKFCR